MEKMLTYEEITFICHQAVWWRNMALEISIRKRLVGYAFKKQQRQSELEIKRYVSIS